MGPYQRYGRHESLDLGVLGEKWMSIAPPRTFKNQHLLERPPRAIIDHREGRRLAKSQRTKLWQANMGPYQRYGRHESLDLGVLGEKRAYQQPRQEPSKINIC